jgi:Holliday junction DNA helicase RuvB
MDGEGVVVLDGDYPATWDEFVGQDPVKRQLKIAAKSAAARGVPMGHVLLSSPMPGVGKTALALLITQELGTGITMMGSPIKPAQVPYVLGDMKDGDTLFLDEAHRLVQGGKGNAEWLLHVMENGVLTGPLGVTEIPKITVIAATTDAGLLPQPILDRFEITPTIEPYTDDEGRRIALQLASKILVASGLTLPTDAVAAAAAQAGNNSPRHIRRILCATRDLVWAGEITDDGGEYDLSEALAFAGVTADGLSAQMQRYLTVMVTDFRGNPAGQKAIADRLGEVGAGMSELERVLLNKGFIALTKAGRMLTVDGMRRARELVRS